LDLSWYLRFLRAHLALIVITALIGLVLGLASWLIRGDGGSGSHYRATYTLIFQEPPDESTWAYRNIDELALLATGGDVAERAGDASGVSADEVADRTITRTDEQARSLEITVIGRDRDETQRLADGLGTSLKSVVADREQERFVAERDRTVARLQRLADELTDLDNRIANASGAELDVLTAQRRGTFNQYSFTYEQFQQFTGQGTPSERLTTFDRALAIPIGAGDYDASVEAIADGENHLRADPDVEANLPTGSSGFADSALARGLLGAFVGLLIGLALAFGVDRLTPRLRTRRETREVFGVPVLAEIPRSSKEDDGSDIVIADTQPRSRAAEAFRAARSRILPPAEVHGTAPPAATKPRGLVVMVTSSAPQEGKTTTVANLAAVVAETGASVLAVSCDLHRPRLDALLRPLAAEGSTAATSIEGVRFANPMSDASLTPPIAVARQREFVDDARRTFDMVLLDAPPLLTTNDTAELLPAADLVVLVARAGVTKLRDAEQATELLGQLGASVAGVVLVDPYLSAKDPYDEASRSRPSPERAREAAMPDAPDRSEDLGVAPVSR
jgi:Mrp family chromosome partitioning ATPase